MGNETPHTRLPDKFKGYFWDCDFNRLTLASYKPLIMNRLMRYGGLAAMKWIWATFSQQEIKEHLTQEGSKRLDKKSYDFWIKTTDAYE